MIEDLIQERRKKAENFKAAGFSLYPAEVKPRHPLAAVLQNFRKLRRGKKTVTAAGRITGLRNQGGVFFADLKDESGSVQLVAKKEDLANYELFRDNLDIGDFVEASGAVFATKRGEKSIQVKKLRLLGKALRPVPSEWYGLHDTETRIRKRYLDVLAHPELRDLFIKKANFWETFRAELKKAGFLEVETPVLEQVTGGADAEPFVTRHNALGADVYLRISLELPLKKLLVAGFEKVFEIGRIFRNEGIDREHLQDYTQIEFYWAYKDYFGLMKFVEKLYKTVIRTTAGKLVTSCGGTTINWSKMWPAVDYYAAFEKYAALNLKNATEESLRAKAAEEKLDPEKHLGRGRLIDLLFKKLVRPHLVQPCFLINPPADVEPLAKRHRKDPDKVERFQIVACGTELGKGFSELNDPIDQRKRFEEQMKLRAAGDKEAQMLDEDFIEALEYGMPPAAGFGVSERLFAVLMNKPIRETVIFPLMRPKKIA